MYISHSKCHGCSWPDKQFSSKFLKNVHFPFRMSWMLLASKNQFSSIFLRTSQNLSKCTFPIQNVMMLKKISFPQNFSKLLKINWKFIKIDQNFSTKAHWCKASPASLQRASSPAHWRLRPPPIRPRYGVTPLCMSRRCQGRWNSCVVFALCGTLNSAGAPLWWRRAPFVTSPYSS